MDRARAGGGLSDRRRVPISEHASVPVLEPSTKNETIAHLQRWLSGIRVEVEWWREWLATGGGPWPEDYRHRTGPPPDFQLAHLIPDGAPSHLEVLDVGSGPISPLGLVCPNREIRLTGCDALAPYYQEMLRDHGVTPYAAIVFALAERLTDRFPREAFDLVNVRNALDHCVDAVLGLRQIVEVTRIGGIVHLSHFENEGERTGYIGLHQWNLTERDGRFVIWSPEGEHDVADMFADCLEVQVERDADTYPNLITAVLRKKKNAPPADCLGQLQSIYDSFLLCQAAGAHGAALPSGV